MFCGSPSTVATLPPFFSTNDASSVTIKYSQLSTWSKLASSIVAHIRKNVLGRGGEVAYKTITFQSTSISDNSTINNNNENLDDDEAALLSLIGGKK